jgi:hypothetical protein
MTQQAEDNYYKQEENNKVFSEQLKHKGEDC